jgi:hypothetical protein
MFKDWYNKDSALLLICFKNIVKIVLMLKKLTGYEKDNQLSLQKIRVILFLSYTRIVKFGTFIA